MVTLTPDLAREIAVQAQLLPGSGFISQDADYHPQPAVASDILGHLGLMQMDPLMRVGKAHHLTAGARLPARSSHARTAPMDASLWSEQGAEIPESFENFTNVACLFPMSDWPALSQLRAGHRARYDSVIASGEIDAEQRTRAEAEILAVIADSDGVTLADLRKRDPRENSWGWTPSVRVAESLNFRGILASTARQGNQRVLNLAERVVPSHLLNGDLAEDQSLDAMAMRALNAFGIATVSDITRHWRLSAQTIAAAVSAAAERHGLTAVNVDGSTEVHYLAPWATHLVDAVPGHRPPASEARIIGPFDGLLRDRTRAKRLFGFEYLFEAYVPEPKRIYGAYVVGVLLGHEFVARVDAFREGGVLVGRRIWAEPGVPLRTARAAANAGLTRLAKQLGTNGVSVAPQAIRLA